MNKTININMNKTGFPVKIGEVELFFDNSIENMQRFLNIESEVTKKLKELFKKVENIDFPNPEDITEENVFSIDKGIITAAFDINKETIAAQYDVIFGDGTFEKLYAVYPDVRALEDVLPTISKEIGARIMEEEDERQKAAEVVENYYLDRKKAKRK